MNWLYIFKTIVNFIFKIKLIISYWSVLHRHLSQVHVRNLLRGEGSPCCLIYEQHEIHKPRKKLQIKSISYV